jgi:hypothetical protein
VPEYDAFGREIGEDPLAALREATAPAKPAPEPARPESVVADPAGLESVATDPAGLESVADPARPESVVADPARPESVVSEPVHPEAIARPVRPEAVVAEPPKPAPVAARPQFVRPRRRRRGGFAGLIVIVGLIGLLGLLGNFAADRIESGLEGIVVTEEPAGVGPASMIRSANLSAALAQMRESGLGRPLTLRVTPSRVDARLVDRNGRVAVVQVTAEQQLRTVRTGGKSGDRAGIAYSRIDVTAPERLVREAEGRRIRHLRLDRFGWRAYFRDGSVQRG